jgi:hypothetical protein
MFSAKARLNADTRERKGTSASQEADEFVVGRAIGRWGRDADFQGFTMNARTLCGARVRLDVDCEEDSVLGFLHERMIHPSRGIAKGAWWEDPPSVTLTYLESPRSLFKKPAQQGRSERGGEAYSSSYVEPVSNARTTLAGFFNILLEDGFDKLQDTALHVRIISDGPGYRHVAGTIYSHTLFHQDSGVYEESSADTFFQPMVL